MDKQINGITNETEKFWVQNCVIVIICTLWVTCWNFLLKQSSASFFHIDLLANLLHICHLPSFIQLCAHISPFFSLLQVMFEVESQLCCNMNVKELMDLNINVLQMWSQIQIFLGLSAVSNMWHSRRKVKEQFSLVLAQ